MDRLPSRLLWILTTALPVIVAGWIGSAIGARYELQQQVQQLQIDATLRRELLRSEVERHRLLPTTLARDLRLAFAVGAVGSEAERRAVIGTLNIDLEELARTDGAATLYLVDARGITRAASNHRLPTSFIGQDYSFRTYFRDAMKDGIGELFAQGTVSGIPGLYLAHRLRDGSGVVVTKVEFTDLERSWQRPREETLVTDDHGVILLTSVAAERFAKLADPTSARRGWISASLPAAYQDWTLVLRRDVGPPVLASRLIGASIGVLLGILLFTILFTVIAARRRRETQRMELTRLVASRTAELESSNRRLLREMEERSRSEATVQRLREDLAQANRLAILGQISAGVAHEINQPTAAIRTYADNAKRLFERGRMEEAMAALESVVPLTERIGLITDELRGFSRRSPARRERVMLRDVIDGTLRLLEQPLTMRRIKVARTTFPEPGAALADRTRLEQVLVNLTQNAMDALSDTTDARITIDTGARDGMVWIEVVDNGPGVPDGRRDELFAPFSSSKPLGLGLGLVISRDIASDLGGSLDFSPPPDGGAAFIVRVPAWIP